ncbi:MAG: Rne/Rng family ribonuclease [Planctomycetes bacterium]|nr:Rne/Rng family ribonuclease [Planctomycetota bacterium]
MEPLPEDGGLPADSAHDHDVFVASPALPTGSSESEVRRRRRRRGRRGRGGRDQEGVQPSQESDQGDASEEPQATAEEQAHPSTPPASQDELDGDGGRKRRRRRRRGRGREREAGSGPVGVEVIPGDDDELPQLESAPATAPEAQRERRGEGRAGRKEGRARAETRDQEARGEEPRAPKPGKKNIILVNASDREETRVAVVEDGQIVDFQMHVKRHETLVNDIYRGKVVNLEPAIGAAFVDFGQGRNGFLHTSDVLSVYGEKDWSLDKLLTHKIDPEEWDEKSSQPHVGLEFSDRAAAAARDRGAHHDDHADEAHHEHDGSDDEHSSDDHEATLDEHAEGHEDTAVEPDHEAHDEELVTGDGELEELVEVSALEAAPPAAHAVETPPQPKRNSRRGRDEHRGHHGKPQHGRHRARPRLPISDLLQKGQSVVVQVTKDAIGDKGPTLTTYISIPGRYLVLMPSMSRTGVSRKIDDEKERRRLKRILESLDIPPGMGVIVRTAGTGCTRDDLKRDLDYLMLLWDSFGKRLHLGRGPAALYEESDVAIRTIRDLFNDHTEAVIVDDERVYNRVREFMEKLIPEKLDRVQLHQGPKPLFHTHNVEQDFERIFARRIDLASGGSIVFDQAEALVAIDVNSGKTRTDGFDFEDVALRTNLDAVKEIARQIRLRDLGGIIVCDFIDMQRNGSRRQIERALRDAIAPDRARSKLGRISQFGLLELTRQRLGPGLSKMLFHNCPRCRGSGRIRTVESRTGAILRRLGSALTLKGFTKVEVRTQPEVAEYLKRHYGQEVHDLMVRHEREIELVPVSDQIEDSVLRYLRADGREVRPGGRRKR